jgi:TolB-like protein
VVPEKSVQNYLANGATDPVTAGRELGAQVIVRGMAQRMAGRIIVKVQLISAQDGSQIWSSGFEGDSNDVAGLSAKISDKIGKGMPATDGSERP